MNRVRGEGVDWPEYRQVACSHTSMHDSGGINNTHTASMSLKNPLERETCSRSHSPAGEKGWDCQSKPSHKRSAFDSDQARSCSAPSKKKNSQPGLCYKLFLLAKFLYSHLRTLNPSVKHEEIDQMLFTYCGKSHGLTLSSFNMRIAGIYCEHF